MRFSERHGYVEVRTAIQHESMDDGLRTDLWNATMVIFNAVTQDFVYSADSFLCRSIWSQLWHKNADELPYSLSGMSDRIKTQILSAEWYEVYDLVEHICESLRDDHGDEVPEIYNQRLEKNLAGYRVINDCIAPVDSATEIAAIEAALVDTQPLPGAKHHLAQALTLLSDRQRPDYPNSMKESISAVESACNAITGKKTLGDALKHLKTQGMQLHPALEGAWLKMYGYTSDEDGIRHFAADEPKVDQVQAKYFLVTCSAFVSLLLAEAAKTGITAPE